MSRDVARRLALLLLAPMLGGCIQLRFWRNRTNPPIADTVLATITPGSSSLQDCLDTLGAPQLVTESLDGDLVIAYGWQDEFSWGIQASYAFDDFTDASLSWDDSDQDVPGVVLIFDRGFRLLYLERGFLRDLVGGDPDGDPALRALRDTR